MNITTAGVDLAKNLITVCAQDATGRTVERRDLRQEAFASWLRSLPAECRIGMEACSASHYWAREMAALGLEPRIMAAEFVQPFRKSRAGKNDRNDAEAIAIAAREANMRFVAVKSVEQQARLARHRRREGWKEERTALGNRIRGPLAEFGVVIPKSQSALGRAFKPYTTSACRNRCASWFGTRVSIWRYLPRASPNVIAPSAYPTAPIRRPSVCRSSAAWGPQAPMRRWPP
jgi:transposase